MEAGEGNVSASSSGLGKSITLPDDLPPTLTRSANLLNIQEILAENILLKRELRTKLERVVNLQNQLQLQQVCQRTRENEENRILELEGNSGDFFYSIDDEQRVLLDESGDAHLDFTRLLARQRQQNHSVEFEDISQDLEDPDAEGTLNRTISESVMEWVENNRSEVIEKMGKGTLAARDLSLGAISGWTAAYVLKKFGTVALTAFGGGFLLLQLAHHRGYVVVDWNQIYNQLERTTDEDGNPEESSDWFKKRFTKFRQWSKDNSNLAFGFIGGFLYKTYV